MFVMTLDVFDKILSKVPEGLVLYTPVLNRPFIVERKDSAQLVFLTGKTNIEVSRKCWNKIPAFLRGKGWVKIGAKHAVLKKLPEGTLERFLRENSFSDKSKGSQGCYVAPLLEYLGIVAVRHSRPSAVKLIT